MKITLDKSLVNELREKFNEIHVFSYQITSDFHIPTQKRGTRSNKNAFNCLCAALDRITDLIDYLNELEIQTDKHIGTFQLCDFLNQSQTLIDCIDIFGRVYQVPYLSEKDTSSFHQNGLTGNGNDEEYYKYIRSLCSVHPVATNAHPEYQGAEPEWCPYVSLAHGTYSFLEATNPDLKEADFVATIYRNDEKYNVYVGISLKQVFHYIKKRYRHIKKLISGIENYNNERKSFYQQAIMKTPDEFETYREYLLSLIPEFTQRCGHSDYEPQTWAAVFDTHFDNQEWEMAFNEFKDEMKDGISKIHLALQNMTCLNDNFNTDPVIKRNIEQLENYHYEEEKLLYLFPNVEIENLEDGSESFVDREVGFDVKRMARILSLMDEEIKKGSKHEELRGLARYIESICKITDPEWARIQLKIMEPILGRYLPFDYLANDWHLYWQIQIAYWKLS